MIDETLQQTATLVRGDFDLDSATGAVGEEELLALIADRVAQLLETQPEYLFSLLYRLDVLEKKIVPVLHPAAPEPANWGLARLILEREKQRAETKRSIRSAPIDDEDAW